MIPIAKILPRRCRWIAALSAAIWHRGRVRLATFNTRHGAPPGRWAQPRRMAAAVASLRADVVALQEVDRRTVRTWFVDQAAVAARRSGTVALFGAARGFGPGGQYGNALLVRGRVLDHTVHRLGGPGEPRVALLARVVVRDVELTVVSTHLQNRRGDRVSIAPDQLEELVAVLADRPEPWALMGDLNLRADTVEPILGRAGLTPLHSAATYPSHAPRIRIDWIATRGLDDATTWVPDLRSSDHRPVVADLAATARNAQEPLLAADASAQCRLETGTM
jgi:endonuclease/exonuclease/phosphatase family metal-dependent hydrolase